MCIYMITSGGIETAALDGFNSNNHVEHNDVNYKTDDNDNDEAVSKKPHSTSGHVSESSTMKSVDPIIVKSISLNNTEHTNDSSLARGSGNILHDPGKYTSDSFKSKNIHDMTIDEAAQQKVEAPMLKKQSICALNNKGSLHPPARRMVPEAVLKKAETLFTSVNGQPAVVTNNSSIQQPARRISGLFKTGRDRDVIIPEAALKKTESLFTSVNEQSAVVTNNSSIQQPVRRTSGLFKTGRDGDIIIPEAALKKAETLFTSVNEQSAVVPNSSIQQPTRRTSGLFKSGRDRNVTINDAALQKTKTLFVTENKVTSMNEKSSHINTNTSGFSNNSVNSLQQPARRISGLFKTGRDRDVTINDAAIMKTKALFTDKDLDITHINNNSKEKPTRSFNNDTNSSLKSYSNFSNGSSSSSSTVDKSGNTLQPQSHPMNSNPYNSTNSVANIHITSMKNGNNDNMNNMNNNENNDNNQDHYDYGRDNDKIKNDDNNHQNLIPSQVLQPNEGVESNHDRIQNDDDRQRTKNSNYDKIQVEITDDNNSNDNINNNHTYHKNYKVFEETDIDDYHNKERDFNVNDINSDMRSSVLDCTEVDSNLGISRHESKAEGMIEGIGRGGEAGHLYIISLIHFRIYAFLAGAYRG
jgi:hypothetical protein